MSTAEGCGLLPTASDGQLQPEFASSVRPPVAVLMASYNGEPFLADLLESLLNQTYEALDVYVIDDASQDASWGIISRYVRSEKLFARRNRTNAGVVAVYEQLAIWALERNYSYFAFCDQDDIWEPGKVERLLAAIQGGRNGQASELAFCDLSVVSINGKEISESYLGLMGFNAETLTDLEMSALRFNFIPGCSMLFSRALLEFATPFSKHAMMHDWWLVICAQVLGRLTFVDEPLVQYRQHTANTVGAKSLGARLIGSPLVEQITNSRIEHKNTICQACALLDRIEQRAVNCPRTSRVFIETYCQLPSISLTDKFLILAQGKFASPNLLSKAAFWLWTMLLRPG